MSKDIVGSGSPLHTLGVRDCEVRPTPCVSQADPIPTSPVGIPGKQPAPGSPIEGHELTRCGDALRWGPSASSDQPGTCWQRNYGAGKNAPEGWHQARRASGLGEVPVRVGGDRGMRGPHRQARVKPAPIYPSTRPGMLRSLNPHQDSADL
jgi:hypothetical protein